MINNKKITFAAFCLALAILLQYMEISIPFVPSFLKFDFSDVPQIIVTTLYGPFLGILVCFCKNILHLLISQSGWIGEFSNFILGASFLLVYGALYSRSKKGAIISGIVFVCMMSYFSNLWIIYPLYYKIGFTSSSILSMYQLILPSIHSISQALLIFNVPFTFLKFLLNLFIFHWIYHRIRFSIRL
ncbi:ECF transporter S component [Floccifex sp.]|uniref:ECF transporter S component n=1 Tax=Floccifex sp. TaxID=2815810 RepID=UPI003F0DB3AC